MQQLNNVSILQSGQDEKSLNFLTNIWNLTWMTDPIHFLYSVSFCFFSTSAACYKCRCLVTMCSYMIAFSQFQQYYTWNTQHTPPWITPLTFMTFFTYMKSPQQDWIRSFCWLFSSFPKLFLRSISVHGADSEQAVPELLGDVSQVPRLRTNHTSVINKAREEKI